MVTGYIITLFRKFCRTSWSFYCSASSRALQFLVLKIPKNNLHRFTCNLTSGFFVLISTNTANDFELRSRISNPSGSNYAFPIFSHSESRLNHLFYLEKNFGCKGPGTRIHFLEIFLKFN